MIKDLHNEGRQWFWRNALESRGAYYTDKNGEGVFFQATGVSVIWWSIKMFIAAMAARSKSGFIVFPLFEQIGIVHVHGL